jgi:DNA-binding NarL/FixJ family response regulator
MATTADEADAALAAMGSSLPARIFCDIGLPGRSGSELHESFVKSRPELAKLFVFVTGGVITPEVADYVIASGCPTLLKPVGREEIMTTLERRSATPDESQASAPTLRESPTVPPHVRSEETQPPPAKKDR